MSFIKRQLGWILPFIAAGFLCGAAIEHQIYRFAETNRKMWSSADYTHGPTNEMDIECPDILAEDATAIIRGTFTNDGPTAEFSIGFRVRPQRGTLISRECTRTVTVEHGATYAMDCEISGATIEAAKEQASVEYDEPTSVEVEAYSSEDAHRTATMAFNSYRAVCFIPNRYADNATHRHQARVYLAVGIGLMIGFVAWLTIRNKPKITI